MHWLWAVSTRHNKHDLSPESCSCRNTEYPESNSYGIKRMPCCNPSVKDYQPYTAPDAPRTLKMSYMVLFFSHLFGSKHSHSITHSKWPSNINLVMCTWLRMIAIVIRRIFNLEIFVPSNW